MEDLSINISSTALRAARERRFPGISAAEVARRLKVSRQALNDYEAEPARKTPSAGVLLRMAFLYGVDPRDLVSISSPEKNLQNVYAAS